ncbi:MAG: hypothetical protein BWY64_03479 [bacterium ADurb.Bin363]|nr:MAG: hypothetical protein BWY64_03479 [bacterium ADurb.Bin363]
MSGNSSLSGYLDNNSILLDRCEVIKMKGEMIL